MRSRYTAYALGLDDHVFRTWHPRTRPDDLAPDPGVGWTGLEVLATEAGGPDGRPGRRGVPRTLPHRGRAAGAARGVPVRAARRPVGVRRRRGGRLSSPRQFVYSMCRDGALAAPPSKESAVRRPVPVTITAMAFPLLQPGWPTTWPIVAARSGVRWSAPRAPTVGQDAGVQLTLAAVMTSRRDVAARSGERRRVADGLRRHTRGSSPRCDLVDAELHGRLRDLRALGHGHIGEPHPHGLHRGPVRDQLQVGGRQADSAADGLSSASSAPVRTGTSTVVGVPPPPAGATVTATWSLVVSAPSVALSCST